MTTASWRKMVRFGLAFCGGLAVAALGIVLVLRQEPAFYARQAEGERSVDQEHAETLSRRMVTKAAAWRASLKGAGPWETVVTAAEANGWLACDLPKNHARLLPQGLSAPRVAFEPRHLLCGVRVGWGPLTAVAWIDLEVTLRDVNHVVIAVDRAALGAVPLPRASILRALGRRIGALGMVTDLRLPEGRPVLMVHIPATHVPGATSYRLESLQLDRGELLLAGSTAAAAEPAR